MRIKILFVTICLFCLLSIANAATYYIDANLASNCTGTTYSIANRNCEGTDGYGYKTFVTPNTNAVAGDTIYIRGATSPGLDYSIGEYDDTDRGIIPANSGTITDGACSALITYEVYGDEIVNLVGKSDDGTTKSFGIWINGKSCIKVNGKSLGQLNLTKMGANVVIGPWTGQSATADSSYNEIAYVYAYDSKRYGWYGWWQGNAVWKRAYYNHIHHCKFGKHGYQAFPVNQCESSGVPHACCTGLDEGETCAESGLDNEGSVFDLGAETADEASEVTEHNILENNEFYHGGHNTLAIFGRYNIIRNNYFHNEEWSEFAGTLYGYRNIITNGVTDYVGHNILENNKIGYASENAQIGNAGGGGMKLGSPYNIVRYNDFFANKGNATYIQPYVGSAPASYNYLYNNTYFENGFTTEPEINTEQKRCITFGYNGTSLLWDVINSNVIKNNLFYDNWNSVTGDRAAVGSLGGDYTDGDNVVSNNYDDWVYDIDPLFTSEDTSNPTSLVLPNFALQSTSSAIDYGTNYLTTATKKDNDTMTFADARYFQDGNFGTGSILAWPASATVAADYVCFSTTTKASSCTNKQIEVINYTTGDVTITGHGLTEETTYYVWLYKDSDGTQVLYGNGSDAGAHEYDNSGTPPSYTATVALSGAGATMTHSGGYTVATGTTINIGVTRYNGWNGAWSTTDGTNCVVSGCTVPNEGASATCSVTIGAECTVTYTATQILLLF